MIAPRVLRPGDSGSVEVSIEWWRQRIPTADAIGDPRPWHAPRGTAPPTPAFVDWMRGALPVSIPRPPYADATPPIRV